MKLIRLNSIFFLLLGFIFVTGVFAQDKGVFDHLVSLEFHNESIDNVLKQVARQGKVDLLYDAKKSGKKISGKYTNITVEKALKRIFSGNSFTLTTDPKRRIIIVKTFGTKKYKVISGTDKGGIADIDDISLKEVQVLHKKQVEEIERYLNNPDSMDPLTGKSLGEIRRLHEIESEEIRTAIRDDRIRVLHEKQEQEIESYKKNPKSIDPMSGMTLGEISALHHRQSTELNTKKNDEIDPFTNMSNREIKELHAKQYEEILGTKSVGNR